MRVHGGWEVRICSCRSGPEIRLLTESSPKMHPARERLSPQCRHRLARGAGPLPVVVADAGQENALPHVSATGACVGAWPSHGDLSGINPIPGY